MSSGNEPTIKIASSAPRLYRVFVSSTYLDNVERRKVVQEAIATAGMVWHGMEIFTADTRPTVEVCQRFAGEADVLVGIIAHRYGCIPEGSEKSITEIEYDAARDAGKARLMFVLDPSLPVDKEKDFDAGPDRWKKQEKLDAFQERFSRDQMRAQFTETTLGTKVLKALEDWVERQEASVPENEREMEDHAAEVADRQLKHEIRRYCQKAETLHATLPMAGFAARLKVPINIQDIYVPLHAMMNLRGLDEDCFHDAAHAESLLRECGATTEISLPEAFRQLENRQRKGVVILGDPGAGKTTHLKRLLLWCLREGPERIHLPAGMLPVFLPLRELRDVEEGFAPFIQEQLRSPHLKMPREFVARFLSRGNLLFLLDGLDEVADACRREQVSRWIEEGVRSFPDCRFVVTSRFAGYIPSVHLGPEFLELHIRPLSEEQVEEFVRNWYRIVERELAEDPEQADATARERAEKLIERLKEPDFRARRVFELTRNPLLLTNICLVHRHRGELPRKRARLYQECIEVLLEHWQVSKGLPVGVTAHEGCRALQPAALWLHGREGRTRASAGELAPHIEPALKALGWTKGTATDFLRTIRDESGLLTGWGADEFGFMHLGFQEYLAAREIRSRSFDDPRVPRELASHFGESWWQEVVLLLLALEEEPTVFVQFMREVVQLPAFAASRELVELCLDDAAETSPLPFVELLQATPGKPSGSWWQQFLPGSMRSRLKRTSAEQGPELWQRQMVALSVLARLDPDAMETLLLQLANHPSPEIRRWVADRRFQSLQDVLVAERGGYELVRVPGGVFMMGSPESEDGRSDTEGPLHEVSVPAFYLGRYPVTNEQYGLFLSENPEVAQPKYWAERQFNQPRQPVVGVSWDEARLYAAWAGLRLSSEAEWEYACRSGTGTRYYTGDTEGDLDRAGWYAGNADGRAQAVGQKEPNGFGLYDMHGNVLEWVEDDWHQSYGEPGRPDDGSPWVDAPRGPDRVVRGGSWSYHAALCRAANRFLVWPGFRYVDLGFRLSRSVALGP